MLLCCHLVVYIHVQALCIHVLQNYKYLQCIYCILCCCKIIMLSLTNLSQSQVSNIQYMCVLMIYYIACTYTDTYMPCVYAFCNNLSVYSYVQCMFTFVCVYLRIESMCVLVHCGYAPICVCVCVCMLAIIYHTTHKRS